ncbi:MAG: DUF3179 domain-containing protein [Actinomycetota bacterium]|nr:DUF3179 domain-containing protein [Actinomycetota bacterium]
MLDKEIWNAPPGDDTRARKWRGIVLVLAVLLLVGGAGMGYLVTRSGGEPELEDVSDQDLTDERSDVEPGQRILEAAGGVGPEPLVDPNDLISGGPPPDGIPPIDDPEFVAISEADWLEEREPVIVVEIDGDARAYPLQIMTWHEIANDTVGGVPISVTFCPLCNTAYAFERPEYEGKATSLGTSGMLLHSNLVMYDRATTSLWPQALGQAVIGPLTGTTLERVPSPIVSWEEFTSSFPNGAVLSRDTGFDRDYGQNPYPGYDDIDSQPFLFRGEVDDRLTAVERVLGVETTTEVIAFSYSALKDAAGSDGATAVNTTIGDKPLVVFWKQGTVSALDAATISSSRDVGAAAAFSARVGKRLLEFDVENDKFVDEQTSSTWNLLGRAVDGPLKGKRLEAADAHDSFWFDWAAFQPETDIWSGS